MEDKQYKTTWTRDNSGKLKSKKTYRKPANIVNVDLSKLKEKTSYLKPANFIDVDFSKAVSQKR